MFKEKKLPKSLNVIDKKEKNNMAFITAIAQIVKNITDIGNKAMDSGSAEKFVQNVNELNQGIDDSYAKMREIIMTSDKFTEEEKLEKLEEIAKKEAISKQRCADAIAGNRKAVTKVTMDIIAGFLTCGISFAPGIIRKYKKAVSDDTALPQGEDQLLLEEEPVV